MSRCLKILVRVNDWQDKLSADIQKQAKKNEIEGQMHLIGDNQLKIVVCGKDDTVDDFVDYLYDFFLATGASVEQLEPFMKERDYRGTFRIF